MHSSNRSAVTARKPHVVFVSYYFPPMGGGGVQRTLKFLKFSDPLRVKLSVVTVKPSFFYADDPTLAADLPANVQVIRSGSLDPFRLIYLFRTLLPKKTPDTTKKNRESGGKIREIVSKIFVPDSRLLWLPFALSAIRRLHRQQPVDAIIATLPPFTAGLVGIFAGKFSQIPVVLDYRDGWSKNPYLPKTGALQRWLNGKLEQFCLNNAAGVIFVNPELERDYVDRFSQFEQTPHLTIRNGYDPQDFEHLPQSETSSQQKQPMEIGVMGTIYSQGNCPETLLKAISELKQQDEKLPEKLQLTFLGKWTAEFELQVSEMGLDDIVRWEKYRPHREALLRAAQFDALALAVDSRIPGSRQLTPGRIYEYLALRRPILAMCPVEGDLAHLVKSAKAGEIIEFTDVAAIKQCILDWLENHPQHTGKYLIQHVGNYSRASLTKQLWAFLADKIGLFVNKNAAG